MVVIFYNTQFNIYSSFVSEHFSKYFFIGKIKLINKVVIYEPMNKTFIQIVIYTYLLYI